MAKGPRGAHQRQLIWDWWKQCTRMIVSLRQLGEELNASKGTALRIANKSP